MDDTILFGTRPADKLPVTFFSLLLIGGLTAFAMAVPALYHAHRWAQGVAVTLCALLLAVVLWRLVRTCRMPHLLALAVFTFACGSIITSCTQTPITGAAFAPSCLSPQGAPRADLLLINKRGRATPGRTATAATRLCNFLFSWIPPRSHRSPSSRRR